MITKELIHLVTGSDNAGIILVATKMVKKEVETNIGTKWDKRAMTFSYITQQDVRVFLKILGCKTHYTSKHNSVIQNSLHDGS